MTDYGAGEPEPPNIMGPTGIQVQKAKIPIEKSTLSKFVYFGKTIPPKAQSWSGGEYAAKVELIRNGKVIDKMTARVTLSSVLSQ